MFRDEKIGLLDYLGNMILDIEYEEIASRPREGETYLRIGKDGKWGMINNKAEIIIPPIYLAIEQLVTGWYWVIEESGSKEYLIDPEGVPFAAHKM